MKRNFTVIGGLVLATVLTGSGLAYARGCDGTGPSGMGPMGGMDGPMAQRAGTRFDPAQRAERHLSQLKSDLKITPDQEPLWLAFADKMKSEAGKGMQGMRSGVSDDKLSAPERMAKRQVAMEEHLAGMKSVHESFGRLYAALTPEQKQVADRHANRMGRGQMQQQRPQG